MKWILRILGAVALAIMIVVAIGAALPANHIASQSAQISAPAEIVWKTLADVDAYPSWRSDVKRVDRFPDVNGLPSWRETDLHGQSIPYVVEQSEPPSLLVTRIADPNLPFGGTWTVEIQPAGSGSVVTLTERGEIRNPVFRFVARFFLGYTRTIDNYLKSLAVKFGGSSTQPR